MVFMFKKISPKKISDEIIEQFKEMVNNGQLKPGDELPSERELAEMLGVSRPPLREALNALQKLGFIEIRPRSKIVVRSIVETYFNDPIAYLIEDDIDKVFELLEVRKAMEGWAAYTASKRATEEDIRKLEEIIKRDQRNLREDLDDAKVDADFHVAISMATHNTIQSHLMATWYNLLWKTQKVSREKIFKNPENRKRIADQHLRIFLAIKERDPERASKEARRHIEFVEKQLRKIIESGG